MTGSRSKTVHIIEIAGLQWVTHQRASKIAGASGFPAPVGRQGQSRLWDQREVVALAKVWRREKPWRWALVAVDIAEENPKQDIRRRFSYGSPRTQ